VGWRDADSLSTTNCECAWYKLEMHVTKWTIIINEVETWSHLQRAYGGWHEAIWSIWVNLGVVWMKSRWCCRFIACIHYYSQRSCIPCCGFFRPVCFDPRFHCPCRRPCYVDCRSCCSPHPCSAPSHLHVHRSLSYQVITRYEHL